MVFGKKKEEENEEIVELKQKLAKQQEELEKLKEKNEPVKKEETKQKVVKEINDAPETSKGFVMAEKARTVEEEQKDKAFERIFYNEETEEQLNLYEAINKILNTTEYLKTVIG